MKKFLRSWVCWISLVAIGVVWGLPRLPYYQDWMPYGYELGGIAFVLLYLSFGMVSLGMYGIIAGLNRWGATVSQNWKIIRIGFTSIVLALGFIWSYMKLMSMTLKLQ